MGKSKKIIYTKEWDSYDTPLVFAEMVFIGDIFKMKEIFGFSYGEHYYLNDEQTLSFYRNKNTYTKAKKIGFKKYSSLKFYDYFLMGSISAEKKLIKTTKKFSKSNLRKLGDKSLFKLYLNFSDCFSALVAYYRFCRPDFYELLIEDMKKNLPSPKEKNLKVILSGKNINQKINHRIKEIAKKLKLIGERRFDMHKAWMSSFIKANNLYFVIGERLGLSSLEVQNCTSEEIEKAILFKKNIENNLIKDRIKNYKFLYQGEKFKILEYSSKSKEKKVDLIKGMAAYVEKKVRGKVTIIDESIRGADVKKMNKMPKGNILVTTMTSPDMIPAMKKASAFVTDDGGVLCHAAIVAREMKKPCIIGTKIATKVLHDGDLVEVDANLGIVKIIKKA